VPDIYYSPLKLNKSNTNYPFTVDTAWLYYSTNQGNFWSRARPGAGRDFLSSEPPQSIAVNYGTGAPVTCYVIFWEPDPPTPGGAGRRIKIAQGTPGAMTWRTATLPGTIHSISVDRWNSNAAYAFTNGPDFGVYRTTDAGQNWQPIKGNLPAVNHWDLVSSRINPNIMHVGTDLGVFKTTNGGANWFKFQYGLPIVPVNKMVYIPASSGDTRFDTLRISTFGRGFWQRVLSGNDPLFISTIFDRRFYNLSTSRAIANVPSGAIAVSDSGFAARTTDGGTHWTLVETGAKGNLYGTSFLNFHTAIAVGDFGTILRTTDVGKSWHFIQGPTQSALRAVQFIDEKIGWACGDGGFIIRTEDGGDSWLPLIGGKQETLHALFFLDKLNGWVAGVADNVTAVIPIFRRTSDGGKTWIPWQYPGGIINCIRFVDGKTGFAVGNGGFIMKTTNGGESWEALKSGAQLPLYGCHFISPHTGWVCGAQGIVLKTEDGGKTWEEDESGVEGGLFSIGLSGDNLLMAGEGALLRAYVMQPQARTEGRVWLSTRR
jgi:photosystem II stability/assembly factor-like uncharacterized protein